MRRVLVESPYGSPDPKMIERNVRYARACLRDCLTRGEAPIASHLLYTQPGVLDDNITADRKLGIEAGLVWGALAEASVVYLDLGTSNGMKFGIERAQAEERPIEYRKLPPEVLEHVLHPGRDFAAAEGVCAEWKERFFLFIESGTGDDFCQHLNTCMSCQAAVNREFERQVKAMQEFSKALRK